ncbi:DUF1573 domain-containing protein [Psychroserpens sp.]|uniref:DUF1573 domain-containing protein n=1 Tax=Psychroserpens sp. TaxID=2020870 RepID=UPI001B009AC0|nr:DUF1573 domain-containing protein [Psychroserpens sp.]MBO6608009.1 DUF1573 domain-containing protein [Psychroserpens sp.]MBO6631800.1 DUF1573 domain-containing protein [Psychroserpens sp.]MBO6654864.1 DUF1573 domain-containing protein [Psychroserpens sp.]MBO6683062.1 DUF1573 domain-containing protein [Psychroserpens sp.]MBO6751367.1 DUF1573 domain-containing protein [Psychroserpens sp.]
MKSLKITLLLICLSVISLSSVAQNSANELAGVFQFDEETIDYGTINKNDNGIRVFKFKNSGKSPIVISNIKTSCGCTVPSYSKAPILPGESGTIEVKYATNRQGKFSKSLTIYSNADEPQKRIQIKGNVVKKDSKTIK